MYLHFLVYLTCVHLHFYLQTPTPFYSLILIFTTSLLHITPLSHHTPFINSLLHTLHHNRPCPYMAYHCSAAHILFSTSICAFPCLFHMVQISSYMEKPAYPLLDLHAQVFTLPHSYQCLMLTSTRLLERTIVVSSQYNTMLCHYVFLLQPKNHHTFFHTLHGSGFLLFNIWLPPSLFMRLFFLKLIYPFIVYYFKCKLTFTHLLTGPSPPPPPRMYLVGQIWDWF